MSSYDLVNLIQSYETYDDMILSDRLYHITSPDETVIVNESDTETHTEVEFTRDFSSFKHSGSS